MVSDEELVAAARRGSSEAFRALYDRHRPVAVRLAETFRGLDSDQAADAVQEAFAHAFTDLSGLKQGSRFRFWLLSIVRHRCLNQVQRRNLFGQVLLKSPPLLPDAPSAQEELEFEQDRRLVRELLEAWPEGPERTTAELFYLEGKLSVREIAELLGVNKSVIAMRLERFRSRFKLRLLARLEPGARKREGRGG